MRNLFIYLAVTLFACFPVARLSAQNDDAGQKQLQSQIQKLDAEMQRLNDQMQKLNEKLSASKNSSDEGLKEELDDARDQLNDAKEEMNDAIQELKIELNNGNTTYKKDTVIRIRKRGLGKAGIPPVPPVPPTPPTPPTPPSATEDYNGYIPHMNFDSIFKSVNLDSIMRHMPNVDSIVRQVKYKNDSLQKQLIIIHSNNGSTKIIDSSKRKKTIVITDDGVNIRFKDHDRDGMHRHANVKTRWLGLDFGLNSLTDNGNFTPKGIPADLGVKPWPSRYWRIYVFQQGINLAAHKVYLVYGLNFDFYRYSFKNSVTLSPNQDSFSYAKETPDIKYSHLNTGYLEIPLMLYFETNPYHRHHSFKIGVGGYGGLLLYDNTALYTESRKMVNSGGYPMNDFKYGLQAQMGYGPLQFFAKYSLSPLFDTQKYAPELNTATFGIRLINDFHWGRYL